MDSTNVIWTEKRLKVYILYYSIYIKYYRHRYIKAIGVKTEVVFGKEGESGNWKQAQYKLDCCQPFFLFFFKFEFYQEEKSSEN